MLKQLLKLKKVDGRIFRLVILFLLLVIIGYSRSLKIVNAYNNWISVYPSKYEIEGSELDNDFNWQGIENAFYQDLSSKADYQEFNKDNAAYIIYGAATQIDDSSSSSAAAFLNFDTSSSTPTSTLDGEVKGVMEKLENDDKETKQKTGQAEFELLLINNQHNKQQQNLNEKSGNSVNDNLETEKEEDILSSDEANIQIDNFSAEQEDSEQKNNDSAEAKQQQEEEINQSQNIIEDKPNNESNQEDNQNVDEINDSDEESVSLLNKIKKIWQSFFSYSAQAQDKDNLIKKSIIFSDFGLASNNHNNEIKRVLLKLSLAAQSNFADNIISLEYSLDNEWHSINKINFSQEIISNHKNNGYFSFELPPELNSWDKLNNLRVRLSYINSQDFFVNQQNNELLIFVDALWLEVNFKDDDLNTLTIDNQLSSSSPVASKQANEINLISGKNNFRSQENPSFEFQYQREKRNLLEKISAKIFNLFSDEYKNIKIKAKIKNNLKSLDWHPQVEYLGKGKFVVKIDKSRHFKPGKYSLDISIYDQGQIYNYTQDFSWGVLAINFNKSIYYPDETSFIQMAVLDDLGHTLCNADLYLEITSPNGNTSYLSTENGLINRNPECGPDNVIDTPDYYAYYKTDIEGVYQLRLIAKTANGQYEITDSFMVKDYSPFIVERIGPTRIWPLAEYTMKIKIKSNIFYKGEIKEFLPNEFKIIDQSLEGAKSQFVIDRRQEEQILIWKNLELKPEQEIIITYTFDTPDISPEFYLLGPLQIGSFAELRQWQIASDAISEYDTDDGTSVNWINPTYAWDSTDDTYAARDIPRKSVDDSANYLLATSSTATDLGYTITAVEIGVEGYVEGTTVSAYLVPIFGGSTAGSAYVISGTTLGTVDSDNTYYVDITNDANAPATWTWNDVINLDIKVYGFNTSNSQYQYLYIDQIRIRVTYIIPNDPPTGYFNSASQKTDGSGAVDISIEADDPDDNDVRAKIEYVAGATCDFTTPLDPTLDETDANITADYGDPMIDNNSVYQVGTGTAWIITASGSNTVLFDWKSKDDIPTADGIYCLRLTVNDGSLDQATSATTTVIIDNVAPITPGPLSVVSVGGTSVTLSFGAQSSDTHFDRYVIYYKAGSSGVTENDSAHTDANMYYVDYNGATSTTITGLFPETQYVFNIWAYDDYGNRASSSIEVSTTTTYQLVAPISSFNSLAQKTDGSGVVDFSIEVDDGNDDNVRVKVEYVAGASCNFSVPLNPTLDETDANITADYGDPMIDNNSVYQVGTGTAWIITASGSNTVLFDWKTKEDLPNADGTYCVRITANDGTFDQENPATSTVIIDNVPPTAPGQLSVSTTTDTTVVLSFGAQSSDTNFSHYKIFYKVGSAGVTEDDTEHTDPNLAYIDYNGATTTTIRGLSPETQYVFNIWAYDLYGNKASSTEITATTKEAEPVRAKTVMFFAGSYSGNGTTGQDTNTNLTLPSFNFKLAEKDVTIKNAFIILEAQFESYADNAGDYTGYNLAFDACQESCTADAFLGTGRVLKDDNTVLAYDETESNQVRLILDVTNEAQLATYTGNGVELEGQVGYRFERGTIVNSISYVDAVLVITYTYDEDSSENFTNTVIYPLESTALGDSGTRQSYQDSSCTLDSDCPLFNYNLTIPEIGTRLSDWFKVYIQIYNNNPTRTEDTTVNVNIENYNINSYTFVHENANAGTQGNGPTMFFGSVYGLTENTNQTLEINPNSVFQTYYLLGGEVAETYIASTSAPTKTRTVIFPLGVLTNGADINQASGSVDVYFPENGAGSGYVNIKKAWFRIQSSNYTAGATTFTVSTKVGDNAQSGNWVYNYSPGPTVIKPTFNIIHVIPSSDYDELAKANSQNPKTVTLYTTNGSTAQGGVSAELLITYTYTSEDNGYLVSLELFAGQSDTNGNSKNATTVVANLVAPELIGSKEIRGGALVASYLMSDSALVMPGANIKIGANISTSSLVCSNDFISGADSVNAYAEFYQDISSALLPIDNLSYYACYSTDGGGNSTTGAKMNGFLTYIYEYNPPPAVLRQNDWRWYENADSLTPGTAMAAENTAISDVYLQSVLRLRINIGIEEENFATSSEAFKLQYGKGSDCISITEWNDVGSAGSGTAWEFYDNTSVADNTSLSSILLASSTVAQTYEEENPSLANPKFVPVGGFAEWDWTLYNNAASSSSNYCFRMIRSNGEPLDYYNIDSYPKLTTAAANTAPSNPSNLGQYRDDGVTVISNQSWINENNVLLRAQATDPDINEVIKLYFELIPNADSFTTATSEPASACAYGTAYNSCASKIWVATSSVGFYRYDAFIGTTSITSIPESSAGYKWQVMACDNSGACSAWVVPGANPNFRIDLTPPTPPGNLSLVEASSTSMILGFGSSTIEANFSKYRIFYKAGASGVTESDNEHLDTNLNYIDYNGATTTTVINLSAGTQYVFNIWAYDLAGNKASATVELVATTTSSFTPPSGSIVSIAQKTDGSGAVDIAILVDDPDNDDTCRAKIEYVPGTTCDFTTPLDPTIDETDENVTATYGDPDVDNNYPYQVGTTTAWIITSPGANYVFFDWLSKTDIPNANGTYCVRLTVNDGLFDQDTPYTKLIIIDNVPPTTPGPLTLNSKNSTTITLNFGAQSSDSRFREYKIFYSTSSPVTELDYEHSDPNLVYVDYNGATTTTITDLRPGTQYYINIWAYDDLGNKSSSTQIAVATNYLPFNVSARGQYKSDETTVITNTSWVNESEVRLVASAQDGDTSELLTLYFEFIENGNAFTTATSEPIGACTWGTAYDACVSKIWFVASSSPGNYTVNSYIATTSITSIPDSASGYKWQVLACDDDGDCANSWVQFGTTTPNIKVDTIPPTSPGPLSESTKTSNTITLSFGATTTEANFSRYRIFYSTSSPVTENDNEHIDSNLNYIDYNGATITTVEGLYPETQYYFNIWAYDLAGNKASSTEISITTNAVESTPGVIFYTKNSRTLYYRVWDGESWGAEQTGPTVGSGVGDNIRHIRSIRSDDGGKVAVLMKTWDGVNQEWWATVYRVAANDFVNTTQLGVTDASLNNPQLMAACMASLSGGEFFIVKTADPADGTEIYSWDATNGWVSEGAGPDPLAVLNGCRLVRRPGTDNYLLLTFDDDADVGTAYYYGGSTYSNAWTTWTEHSTSEEDTDNYVGEAYFDPSDNTRGAINYSNSSTAWNTKAKYFVCDNTSISYGLEVTSPITWTDDFVHGEFASDPGSIGIAYYAGRDIDDVLSVLKVDISSGAVVWATTTNGNNISASSLYQHENDSQKPFAITFYKDGKGVVLWNNDLAATPKYRIITTSDNSVDSTDTAVPGADVNVWSRVRVYDDPNENEFLAVYQNDDIDYAVVFWDGANNRFYNTTDNPGSGQVWTEIATSTGAFDYDDEATSFSYTKRNSAPYTPTDLIQLRGDASTTIANGEWINESDVYLQASANDPDTSEVISLYVQLIDNNSTFATSTEEPTGACTWGTAYDLCSTKIWFVASSSPGDYSVTPFTDSVKITNIPDSSVGYKWQVIACDDQAKCSSWAKFNLTAPNFYVDTTPPTAPGALSINSKTSTSITLDFGAQTTEANFSRYRIFYSTSSPVTELDLEHTDSNLNYIDYNGATETTVYLLKPETLYYFNIWAYDLAGNKASSTIVSTTTNQAAFLNQSSYVFENDDGATVDSNTVATSVATSLINVNRGERITVRFQVENTGGDLALNTVYKLQYENQTDAPGTWVDVGGTTEISYTAGLAGSNGDIISISKAGLNSNTWTNGSWQEGVGQTGVFTFYNGYYTEFAFMIETSKALLGKTYRLRLYNFTDDKPLDNYDYYPTITIVSSDSKRYSKEAVSSLPLDELDLSYYFDPSGYDALDSDDGNYDEISASGQYPVFNFAVKNSNNTDAMSVTWNGQSNVSALGSNIVLQVYHFGTTNAWETVAINSTADANTDFSLSASLNSNLSEYYSASYWTFWRVYQEATSSQILKSDYFNINFSPPTSYVSQIHYRWRNDDGNEITATWREAEDTGDPLTGTPLAIGDNIRLRVEVVNTGGGTALNYDYVLQYASTTGSCATDPGGWVTVPILASTTNEHFEMATSSYFVNGTSTTALLANTEGYTFVNGKMVEDPSNSADNITLSEGRYTEVEFVFRATINAISGGTYCFRVINATNTLDSYDILPELTLAGITNTAPDFSVAPSDNGSASTSPTNYGYDVVFTATADDPQNDNYYLAICKTNEIVPGNDAPPICTGGEWCISDLASSTIEATCSYTAATSTESLAWYAFVCDKHAGVGVAKCSTSSQGVIGTVNGSPFVINHPPVFTSVSTAVDNQDPGSAFTITTVSSESDIVGGEDTIYFYVCRTNSASFAGCTGGAADTICSVTGTTTDNVSCIYQDVAPTPAGTYVYYAFMFDNHGLAATTNSLSSSYTINNVPPVLGTLVLNNGNDITLNMRGAPDTEVQTVNYSIVDQNGCTDLVSATAVIYMSGVTGGYNCTADYNNCYQISTAACILSDCLGDDDTTATYTCTANFKYFANPTDASLGNPWEIYNWLSYMTVYDGVNYVSTTSAPVELLTTQALDVYEDVIDFGNELYVGDDTGDKNSTTTIINAGNCPIDSNVSGTDMIGDPTGTITVNNIEWDLSNFTYSFGNDLSTLDQLADIVAPKATTTTDVYDQIFWGIGIPYGSDASIYTGQNYFSVVLDSDGW